MRRFLIAFFILCCSPLGATQAMDGVFDRSAEIAKYMEIVKSGTRGTLTATAKDIYVSGIADPALAAAVNERILGDYKSISDRERSDSQYGAWIVKALASFGIAQYVDTLREVRKNGTSSKMRSACDDELDRFDWHKAKNELMASRRYYVEGDNPRALQLFNLLKSDDFTYKYFAADRISWEKLLEPKVLDEISVQLLQYMDATGFSAGRAQTKTLGLYAKLLGYSAQAKYRDTLQKVVASKAGMLVKKHAKEALDRLQ